VSAKIVSPFRSTSASRAQLSRVLLFYWLGIVTVITLAPFEFSRPSTVDVLDSGDWLGIASRAMLFVPLGFLYPLTRQGRNPGPLPVFGLGLLLGAAMAAVRPLAYRPVATTLTVVASAVGAGAGAYLLQSVNRRIWGSARLSGRLSLEIPLVALIYLILPPLLATSLSAADDSSARWFHLVSLLPLGLLGARLMSAVQENHFGPGGVFRTRSIAVVAGGWMALGVFPVLLRHPAVGIGLVVVVALATARWSSIPAVHGGARERRFEADTLRDAATYIVAFFVIATCLPLFAGLGDWRVAVGLTGFGGDLSRQLIGLLAPITSLAMLGYVVAEARGRRELPFGRVALRIAAEGAAVAFALEASRGFLRDAGASVLQFVVMIGASVLGAGIYHSQRERIHAMLIPRAAAPPPQALKNIGVQVAIRG